jgi:tetratricopeptide (TPR) repeat protein
MPGDVRRRAANPIFRVYASKHARRLLTLTATTVLVAGSASLLAGPSTGLLSQVGWGLFGAAFALLAVVLRTRTPEEECAFCRKARPEVKLLVAGPSVAICDECANFPMAIVAEEFERRKEPREWHRRYLDCLPLRCPVALSRPLIERVAAKAADRTALREVAALSLRLGNNEAAAEILQRIPEPDRQSQDWLSLGVGLGHCGRYDEAIAATVKALEGDDGTCRPVCLNNLAWFRVRSQPDAPESTRTEWLTSIAEAKRLLADRAISVDQTAYVQACHGTEAELLRSLGDREGALRALSEADKLGPHLRGERLLIRARVLADSGQMPEAHEVARQALEVLHPDSLAAREANELLAKPV